MKYKIKYTKQNKKKRKKERSNRKRWHYSKGKVLSIYV